jgi:hypothetical protein
MVHQSLKLVPGVDQNKTPALNEAAISYSQLIRFIPDRTLGGLVQKLGGWLKYPSQTANSVGSIARALWAWEDTNNHSYLAVGADGIAAGGGRSLQVVSLGGFSNITPTKLTANVAVDATTDSTASPPDNYAVLITDSGRNVSSYDVVDIQTQISVGGIVLFGLYQCYNSGGSENSYTVYATSPATSTVTGGGQVPSFTTAVDSAVVTVTLADHGYIEGDTFPILVATTISTITLYGNYRVNKIVSSSVFEIGASNTAQVVDTVSENNGQARFVYYKGSGPLPLGTGYGIGAYGDGGYGTGNAPTLSTGTQINAADWTLDNWGEVLIACPLNGPIYQWTPNAGNTIASVIPEAPSVNEGMFVAMPQRQIVAWGSTYNGIKDPLQIRWCDVENYNDWIFSPTNQAGGYRIPKGSRIVQCIQGPQQGLIWTDLGCWSMQYIGPPYAYSFNEIGTGCGLIGRKAAGSVNGVVYWMGPSQFYRLSGAGVEPIRCPVWDVIFQDIDRGNLDSIRIAPNSRFGEIAWHYPTIATRSITNIVGTGSYVTVTFSGPGTYVVGSSVVISGVTPLVYNNTYTVTSSTANSITFASSIDTPYGSGGEVLGSVENNAYVKYNFVLDQWDYSANSDANPYVARSAWTNESVLGPPIGAALNQYLYQHETSQNADDSPMVSYFQTGYFVLTEADVLMFIDQVWPDMKWGYFGGAQSADILLTFYVTSYPNETPIAYGPYPLNQATKYITPRFRGRLVSIKIESNDPDSWWRLGNMRYRVQQDGRFL